MPATSVPIGYAFKPSARLSSTVSCVCWDRVRKVKLVVGHLIVRTIYTPSELKSIRIMPDNSGVCKLLDLAIEAVTQPRVYDVADLFFKEKEKIERNLCQTTDNLFKPTNRIILFDLTNFNFESRKDASREAQFEH